MKLYYKRTNILFVESRGMRIIRELMFFTLLKVEDINFFIRTFVFWQSRKY